VEIFPIIVLLLFFSIFMGMIIWIIRMDKKYVTKMENMPLDSSDLFKTKLESENAKNK
jgi:cytochrome c oxidase cbb3-type subunit 3